MCINEVQEVEEKLGRSSVGRDKHLRTFFRIMQEFSRSRKLNESQTGLKKKNSHVDERNYRKKKKTHRRSDWEQKDKQPSREWHVDNFLTTVEARKQRNCLFNLLKKTEKPVKVLYQGEKS